MPPPHLRDIKCFTDVNTPILPFLAPRLFSEPPFSTRPFQHAQTPLQNTGGKRAPSRFLGAIAGTQEQVSSGTRINDTGYGRNTDCTARRPSSRSVPWDSQMRRIKISGSSSPNQSYVGISAFARCSARAYSANTHRLIEDSIPNPTKGLFRNDQDSVHIHENDTHHNDRRRHQRRRLSSFAQKKLTGLPKTRPALRFRMRQKGRTQRFQEAGRPLGDHTNSASPRSDRKSRRNASSRYEKLQPSWEALMQKKKTGRGRTGISTTTKHTVCPATSQVNPYRYQYISIHQKYLLLRKNVRDLRRRGHLIVQNARYENCLSYRDSGHDNMLVHGRYRYLMRTLFNLRRRKREIIDFSQGRTPGRGLGRHYLLTRVFAALDFKVFPILRQIAYPAVIKHHPKFREWASSLVRGCGNMDEKKMAENWTSGLYKEVWDQQHLLLLYLLDTAPDRALEFLRMMATHGFLSISPKILADALEHLAGLYVQRQDSTLQLLNSSYFVSTFCLLFKNYLSHLKAVCTDDLLYNIGRLSSPEDLRVVWRLLTAKSRYHISTNTVLQYAHTFALHGACLDALHCIKLISVRTKRKFQYLRETEKFINVIATIIRKGVGGGQNYHMTNTVVSELLSMSVTLGRKLFNAVIANAVEAKDLKTAFRVYELSIKRFAPTEYTYSHLLLGCMESDNPAAYRSFAETCAEMAVSLRSPILANDYLYYIRKLSWRQDPAEVMSAKVLYAYSRLFRLEPLVPFGLSESLVEDDTLFKMAKTRLDALSEFTGETERIERLEPNARTMTLILQLEMQKAAERSVADLSMFVAYFKKLVAGQRWPVLQEVYQNVRFWDSLIYFYCRLHQFESASQVIKTMLEGDPEGIPRPNLYIWNTFMRNFFNTGQVQAARHVFDVMESRGVRPNKGTYATMIMGYVKAQDIEGLKDVMPHISEDDMANTDLLQHLMLIRNQKALVLVLEQVRQTREEWARKEAEAVEAAEAERKKRWAVPQLKSILSLPAFPLSTLGDLLPAKTSPTPTDRKGRPLKESRLRVKDDMLGLDD